jgi:hypothetical protein
MIGAAAPPKPTESQPMPVQPGDAPQGMAPPPAEKPMLPEPMRPTQPVVPPLEQRAELARKRKARLIAAFAILIAAILALLWWLIG